MMIKPWATELGPPLLADRAFDPMTLLTIGTTVVGTGVSALGTIMGGRAQADMARMQGEMAKQEAEYQAAQLEDKAKEEHAAARIEADDVKRKKVLAQSALQARGAAGGFLTTDAAGIDLAEGIERQGTLQEGMTLHGGLARRAGLEGQARAERWSGNMAYEAGKAKAKDLRRGTMFDAASTIIGGVGTLAGKYDPKTRTSGQTYRYG